MVTIQPSSDWRVTTLMIRSSLVHYNNTYTYTINTLYISLHITTLFMMTWAKSLNWPPYLQHNQEEKASDYKSLKRVWQSRERRRKKQTYLNEEYNLFTCENSHLLCKTYALFQTFKIQTAFFQKHLYIYLLFSRKINK